MEFDDRFWLHSRRTKKVEGGIKARTARFGETWWSAKWLEAMGSKKSNRLARGRNYARRGQITDFQVSSGKIMGRVQGSAEDPYQITIRVPAIPQRMLEKLATEIKSRPIYAASLLNREMPAELVLLFEKHGLLLFPYQTEFDNECSCPDHADPCKHIAALFYLFSLELERDPVLLLTFHGFNRDDLLAQYPQVVFDADHRKYRAPEPLPENHREFWRPFRAPADLPSSPPQQSAVLIKQLASFPLWRGEADLVKTLEQIYAAVTRRALQLRE